MEKNGSRKTFSEELKQAIVAHYLVRRKILPTTHRYMPYYQPINLGIAPSIHITDTIDAIDAIYKILTQSRQLCHNQELEHL